MFLAAPTVAAPSTAEIQRLAPPISTQATLENFPSSSTLRADLSIPGVTTTNLEPLAPLTEPQDDIDTNALPPVTAPPSHPSIDPSLDGSIEGRSIIEVDLSALSDKPWRKPGSDISDWFNYGFDEVSWEAYCYRRRDVGDLTTVLKTAVLVCRFSFFSFRETAKSSADVHESTRGPDISTAAGSSPNGHDRHFRYVDPERCSCR